MDLTKEKQNDIVIFDDLKHYASARSDIIKKFLIPSGDINKHIKKQNLRIDNIYDESDDETKNIPISPVDLIHNYATYFTGKHLVRRDTSNVFNFTEKLNNIMSKPIVELYSPNKVNSGFSVVNSLDLESVDSSTTPNSYDPFSPFGTFIDEVSRDYDTTLFPQNTTSVCEINANDIELDIGDTSQEDTHTKVVL